MQLTQWKERLVQESLLRVPYKSLQDWEGGGGRAWQLVAGGQNPFLPAAL